MTIYDLAEILHNKLCCDPHDADMLNCPYYYEDRWVDKWISDQAWVHKKWLEKAFQMEADTDLPLSVIAGVIRAL